MQFIQRIHCLHVCVCSTTSPPCRAVPVPVLRSMKPSVIRAHSCPAPRPAALAHRSRALTYTATGLSIDKSVPVSAALLNAGRAFRLATNVDVAPLKYDLVISRGVDQVGLSNGVVVPDVQATGTGIFVPQRLPVLIPGAGKKRRRAVARK